MTFAQSTDIYEVTLDTRKTYQVIEGFGASAAWWPTWICDFPREEQLRMLRLLFTNEGAGLNIYRYNIPAGSGESITDPYRRTPDLEVSPGVYDFKTDAIGIGFMRDAREMGIERFVLFANSPPARMTRNGMTSGGDNGASNIDLNAADDFARYLVDITEHLKAELDLPYVTLSPINEPQWDWGKDRRHQEGCQYTPEEVARTIRAVYDEVRRRGLDIEVEAPESGAWDKSEDYAKALFSDPVLNDAMDTFAVHSYWSNRRHKREFTEWFTKQYPDKTISMTEFCQMKPIHDTGIDGGLHLANVIHDDMTIGSVITWQWWLAIATGGYADGLIYADPKTKKIEVTKRLWVMAHYARFIPPGSQRIEAATDDPSIQVSAYLAPDAGSIATVLTNHSEADVKIHIDMKHGEAIQPDIYWLTTDDQDLAEQSIEGGTASLPARSIATVVTKLKP